MKDEEMAEEYCNHLQSEMLAYTPENPRQQRTVSLLDVEEAFLAGLKAGGPQWHDLRKDLTDLPKDSKEVSIITSDNRKHIGFYNNGWFCQDSGGIVIAWCEIPTFDKE